MEKLDFKLIISLLVVAIVWGTTYLGIRVAVETIPPWYVTSIRQGIAASILLIYLLATKQLHWIGWKNFGIQLLFSFMMLVFANGFTTVAEKSIPSGLTSVLSALSPLIVYFVSILVRIEKPSFRGFIGILFGFCGVLIIFKDGLTGIFDPNYKRGILFISFAILSWSLGTVFSKISAEKEHSITLNLFYQFLIAAVFQGILAVIIYPDAAITTWSMRSIGALLYLAIFGSVLAMFSYYYALEKVSASQISMLNYVNIIIAVFLGWLILNEKITANIIIATILIILGVFITSYKKK